MYGKFKFFSFNKQSDWNRGWMTNLTCTDGLRIPTTQRYIRRRLITAEELGKDHEFLSAVAGPYGLIFLMDQLAGLWTYDYRNRRREVLIESGHGQFTADAMISGSGNHLYIVDRYPNAPVICYSMTLGSTTFIKLDSGGGRPLALTTGYGNEAFLAVGRENAAGGHIDIWRISPSGHAEIWADLSGITDIPAMDLYISYPGGSSLYLLDGLSGRLWICKDGKIAEKRQLEVKGHLVGLGVDQDGGIYSGDTRQEAGTLSLTDRFLLNYPAGNDGAGECLAYSGWVDGLTMDPENRLFIWNGRQGTMSILEKQDRINTGYNGSSAGVYILPPLDSTESENEWHRITLDADIPNDTQIKVSYFAVETLEMVLQGRLTNLETWLGDETLSMQQRLELLEPLWSKAIVNPRDALLRNARGRYLMIKIELGGSETSTPCIDRMRIYFPRMTMLDYMPAVYQQDAASRDFLSRYLAIFGSMLDNMEEKIDNIAELFDAETVAGSVMDWLASWLGIAVDDNWDDETLRKLIIKAPYIFARRGTREALEIFLEIFTGVKPLIVEHFQFKHFQETTELKELMEKLYGQDPYAFTVLLNPAGSLTTSQVGTLQSILAQEKPAFTDARLVILQPWMYMDMHSYLGINTYLSELTPLKLDNQSAVPFNSLIIDQE
ncbi:MAG: hypothetical protein GXY34_10945 [Syntrophomonadaceae bacterium]|nr:hypothetical protein [Syntrophomonadaceae bacterium]